MFTRDTASSKAVMNAPVSRKSDSFLRTSSSSKPRYPESTGQPPEEGKDCLNPTEILRERLGRMFSDEAKPIRRKSTDVANTVNAKTIYPISDTQTNKDKKISDTSDYHSIAPSIHSLPLKDVPDRRSSLAASRQASLQDFPSWKLPPPAAAGRSVPARGRAESPVKASAAKDAVSSDTIRSSSRTFIRSTPPLRLLNRGNISHRRIQLSTTLKAPLFVGGGTIEGQIRLAIDQNESGKERSKPLLISKLSVDIVGLEEISDGRKSIFLTLATELFDNKHPPPPTVVASQEIIKGSELFWQTHAGVASIPFCINLPLNIGPPPYISKRASIRYVLLPTLVLKSGDKKSVINQLHSVQMLTIFDPCKALASLPNPLIATETLELNDIPGPQSVKLTAGLHRQTWVSGNSIFVDIHIVNKSQRLLKKFELQLQRSTLWYAHAAAGTGNKDANHLRLPKKQDNDIISSSTVRKESNWNGTPPNTSEVRTFHVQVPQGHVTISTGRFFEVRYFLNVVVAVTLFKSIIVQLPITLIHMNSLDIMPNALAQVAASIEAKRSKTLPVGPAHGLYQPYHQGQAFVAPQKRSLEQARMGRCSMANTELDEFKKYVDSTPNQNSHQHQRGKFASSDPMKHGLVPRTETEPSPLCHHRHGSDCYHCHLLKIEHEQRPRASGSQAGPTLPRLQVSTSGLGFTESELSDFSMRDPPLRKVMLSEQERRMIHQQRELHQRKEWTAIQRRISATDPRRNSKRTRKERAILPDAHILLEQQIRRAEPHVLDPRPKRRSKTIESALHPGLNPNVQRNSSSIRKRANTGPEMYKKDIAAREVTFPQEAVQLCRPSSRQRGKMPADQPAAQVSRPSSKASLRYDYDRG